MICMDLIALEWDKHELEHWNLNEKIKDNNMLVNFKRICVYRD